MPLYIEKKPIILVGMGFPIFIGNMYAHRVIDDDTSRIMILSTVGAELNTLQHFGHNSRKITIRGRFNLILSDTSLFSAETVRLEKLLTGIKILKETKSAVLLLMNHSLCYGIIKDFRIIDDRDYPTSFDYEMLVIEKDLFGLKFSATAQALFSRFITPIINDRFDNSQFVSQTTIIPQFTDIDTSGV